MGFLNFLQKKKKEESSREPPVMPLPPPDIGGIDELGSLSTMPNKPEMGDDIGLPDFAEGSDSEELKLPDISEFQPPEDLKDTELAEPEAIEFPAAKTEFLKPIETNELEFPVPEETKPVEEEASEVYKHTPAKPTGGLFHKEKEKAYVPAITGDVFIRAEDYRDLMEDLNRFITEQKQKTVKEESDKFRAEEREHEKFISAVEDMQRSLVVTENTLFE